MHPTFEVVHLEPPLVQETNHSFAVSILAAMGGTHQGGLSIGEPKLARTTGEKQRQQLKRLGARTDEGARPNVTDPRNQPAFRGHDRSGPEVPVLRITTPQGSGQESEMAAYQDCGTTLWRR
jgi:hypothetical protein